MPKQLSKKRNEKTNPILWFLFAIVIPLIVAIVLVVIVLSVAGINVTDWAKNAGSNIPVISNFVKTDEQNELEEELEKKDQTIETQTNEIEQLQDEIAFLQAENDELNQEIVKLENQLNGKEGIDEEEGEQVSTIKQTSSSFRKMDKEKAALIFQNMERSSAVSILKELSNDVRGEILQEMEPELAAELTELLMNP